MNGKKKFKIRASMISQIMSDPKGGTPMTKYLKAVENLEVEREKYEKIKNKETATAQKKWDKILMLEDDVNELEKYKDNVVLSKTCKSYVEQWIKEEYFGRPKELDTKAIQKGIECENEAVFVLNKALGTNFKKVTYKKGEKLENEYITGHEDIDDATNKTTWDTKVSYSFDSFPIIKESLEPAYYWQGQGYMDLKKYNHHKVAKVLVNSPAWLVKQELYNRYMKLSKKYEESPEFLEEEYEEQAKKIFMRHVFDKNLKILTDGGVMQLSDSEVIPTGQRVHIFEVERDEKAIEAVHNRVKEIRMRLSQNGY